MAKVRKMLALILMTAVLAGIFTFNATASGADGDLYPVYTAEEYVEKSLVFTGENEPAYNATGFWEYCNSTYKVSEFDRGGETAWAQYSTGSLTGSIGQIAFADGFTADDGAFVFGFDFYTDGAAGTPTLYLAANINANANWATTKYAAADRRFLASAAATDTGRTFGLGHSTSNTALWNVGQVTFEPKWYRMELVVDMFNKQIHLFRDGVKELSGEITDEVFYGLVMEHKLTSATGPTATADFNEMLYKNFSFSKVPADQLVTMYATYTNKEYRTKELPFSGISADLGTFWDFHTGNSVNYCERGPKNFLTQWGSTNTGVSQLNLGEFTAEDGAFVFGFDLYANLLTSPTLEFYVNQSSKTNWAKTQFTSDDRYIIASVSETSFGLGHSTLSPDLWANGQTPLADEDEKWYHYDLVVDMASDKVILYKDGIAVLSGEMPLDTIYGFAMAIRYLDTSGNPAYCIPDEGHDTSAWSELLIRNYSFYKLPKKALVPTFAIENVRVEKKGVELTDLSSVAAGDTLTATVELTNTEELAKDYMVSVVVFNGNTQAYMDYTEGTLYTGDVAAPSFSFTVEDTTDLNIKVFVWDGMQTMTPYVVGIDL